MKELRIVGPFHNPVSGYGKATRAMLAAALCAGFRVQAVETELDHLMSVSVDGTVTRSKIPKFRDRPIPACQHEELREALRTEIAPDSPTLILQPQDGLSEWPQFCGGPRIGLTMTEAEPVNPLWLRAAQNVDLLCCPSSWNREIFLRESMGAPIALMPLCLDERLWSPVGPVREISDRPDYLFLAVFSTCERKHWRELIQAFSEEFVGEDVGLLLKPTHVREVKELADWSKQRGVWIEVLQDENLTDEQMASLYRAADCFALPSAEGFGLTFIEAAACGLHVIGLNAGGTADFVKDEIGAAIKADWEPCVGHLPALYRSQQLRPTAAVRDIRIGLRSVYERRYEGPGTRPMEFASLYERGTVGAWLSEIVDKAIDEYFIVGPVRTTGRYDPPVVALITTYNHLDRTIGLVESIVEHGPHKCGIVVVDDGSTDGTQQWCQEIGCTVLQTNGHNLAANRNLGIRYIASAGLQQSPVIVMLDNDVEVTADWWQGLRTTFEENPQVGILAPIKRLPDGSIQNTGNRIHFDGATHELKLDRIVVWPDYVETACMAVRPEVWRDIAFDEQFTYMYEDVDYCFQARQAGWEVAATNRTSVVHHAHTTSSESDTKCRERRPAFMRKWKDQL